MKLHDINFLDIKKIGEKYMALAHYNNGPIIFNIDNLELFSEVYKIDEKITLDFVYDDTVLRLLKLLEKYICEYVYKKNNIKIEMNKFIEKTFYSKIEDNKLVLELHKKCLFLEEDELSNQKQINFKEVKKEDYCNLKVHFVGINFLEKNFEGIFIVRKVTKQVENDEDINELILDDDTEEEDNKEDIYNILENDDKIHKLIVKNYDNMEINI